MSARLSKLSGVWPVTELFQLTFPSCPTYHQSPFTIPSCPVYDSYVTELCRLTFPSCPTHKQSLIWVISVHLPKMSNLQLIPSLSYLVSPSQTLQPVTVISLSFLGSRFEAVQLARHFNQLFAAHFVTWRNIRCFSVFSVMICSRVTCSEVSEMVQLPQKRWQIMCYHNFIPFYTFKILFIRGNKRKPARGCNNIFM